MIFESNKNAKPLFLIRPPKYDPTRIMLQSYSKYHGNSVLILACNITNYYHALSFYNTKRKFGDIITKKQLLYAAAIINSLYYLDNNQISFSDLQKAVEGAIRGEINVLSLCYPLKSNPNSETCVLYNLIITLETIMFYYEEDIPTDPDFDKAKTICESLLDMEPDIIALVEKEMSNSFEEIYKIAKSIIKKYIKDKSFVDTVKSFK